MVRGTAALLLAAALLGGCATQPHPTGFYWGNYSQAFYEYQKDPNASTLQSYKDCLLDIISRADSGRSKVPPGVFAELGKLYLDEGNGGEAIRWFQREATTFPESGVLMKSLIEKAGKA
ncbi:Hypothetical protein HDN1F_26890 [gamma proteobacterium HdN1]|nr:Hypothetical protein HDN1F_26890 [gamma proteobacterium HdN1]